MSEVGPPTSEELENLVDACEQDPGSRAFVDLGNAYLALERPRDALRVGVRGLKLDPANLDGRLMIGRALIMGHDWKQAQAELLRVVKADRGCSEGFKLLGEVLLRRTDYDRALPVLQHAQNLDPANPGILALLKRARARAPLDPPPPIPAQPPEEDRTKPRPTPERGRPPPAAPRRILSEEPTDVAKGRRPVRMPLRDHPGDVVSLRNDATEQSGPPKMTADYAEDGSEGSIRSRLPLRSDLVAAEPSSPLRLRSAPPPPPPRTSETGEATRPRPKVKPRPRPRPQPADEAKQAAHDPVAMSEDYLNDLLSAGLGEVSGVGAREDEYDSSPDKDWGRSSRRLFVALFAALFLAVAGGTGWYLFAKSRRSGQVARHLSAAKKLLSTGRQQDLTAALAETRRALDKDKRNVYGVAVFAEIGALSALLYKTDPAEAEIAASAAATEIEKSGGRGRREVMVARAALTLALLGNIEAPVEKLTEARAALDVWLEEHPEDSWARWLQGRAMLAVGYRSGARIAFQHAAAVEDGAVVAVVDRADMMLDDGDYAGAMKLYEAALQRAPDHPFAIVGRAIARAEHSAKSTETAEELNATLAHHDAPRVDSYRNLAYSLVFYSIEDYAGFARSLGKSVGIREPRYLARVGLGRLRLGRISDAADVRSRIKWYGSGKPEPHPLVATLDAELYLAYGLPEPALGAIGDAKGVRAHRVRGRAFFDQRDYEAAMAEFDAALGLAPNDRDARAWRATSFYLATRNEEREAAAKALDELRRTARLKLPGLLQGLAYLRTGDRHARQLLEESLAGIDADRPNPQAYRAHVALAELDFHAEDLESATKHLDASLEQNGGYLPAHGLLGRIYLATDHPAAAAKELQRLIDEQMADAALELAYAEAMVTQEEPSEADRERARQAIKRVVDKGAKKGEELSRVAWLVDEVMAEEMEIRPPRGWRRKR